MKVVESAVLAQSERLRPLLAVLQLASPALPAGGFAYSQGLEKAIEDGEVSDARSARRWIEDMLLLVVARLEAPLWLRAFDACASADSARLLEVNAELLATRETAELRAETRQMGASLVQLFGPLGLQPPSSERARSTIAYPAAFACASAGLGVERTAGLAAYLWAWAENQVLVAVKVVPLGQQAGQTMLAALRGAVIAAVDCACQLGDDELGTCAIGHAVASARHETQYSRMFRS